MLQEVISYNLITREELATNLDRLIEQGYWIDLLRNTCALRYQQTDTVGFTSWIVVCHKIGDAKSPTATIPESERCMDTFVGIKGGHYRCERPKDHEGTHYALTDTVRRKWIEWSSNEEDRL